MLDCHTHVFRPPVAARLCAMIGEEFNCRPEGNGTPEDLLAHLDAARCTYAICLSAALTPGQMIPANNWAIDLHKHSSRLLPFGTVHPDHPSWEKELDRLTEHGIRGLKLHPDLCGIPLDDPRWHPIWEAASNRFLILTHMGPSQKGTTTASPPRALAKVLTEFPKLSVIAAHFGGMFQWEESLELLAGRNVFFDTSCSLHVMPLHMLQAFCTKHDQHRILFGSDYPLFSPSNAYASLSQALQQTNLSQKQLAINAQHLLRTLL